MKLPLLCALPLLAATAHACINDSDSDALALQAGRVPEAVRVITGRFDRNPPRYYDLRLRYALEKVRSEPRNWKLYDDIGASLDRLGRDSEALQWMERKRERMPRYDPASAASRDAWYRYYANAGTFRAHRWLHNGAKPADRREMVQAHAYIRRALQINPRAHFDREKYQLLAMEWLLKATADRKSAGTLGDFLSQRLDYEHSELYDRDAETNMPNRTAAIDGLSGLIVLGAAWRSPDVFDALATALDSSQGAGLAYMARIRTEELLLEGSGSFGGLTASEVSAQRKGPGSGYGLHANNRATLDQLYPRLRQEADAWAASRDRYMAARFARYQHPDWDKTFWSDWKPAAPPSYQVAWFSERTGRWDEATQRVQRQERMRVWGIIGGAVLLSLALLWVVGRRRR